MTGAFFRFLRFYNHLLHKHKYPVQIATGGLLWFAGDLLAQGAVHTSSSLLERRRADREGGGGDDHRAGSVKEGRLIIDWHRTARMTAYGIFISAPVFTFWYSFLDRVSHRAFQTAISPASTMVKFPLWFSSSNLARHFFRRLPSDHPLRSSTGVSAQTLRTWKIIGFKLAADGLLFDPLYLSLFFTTTNLMEGKGMPEIVGKLRTDLFSTYLVDVFVWTPVQTLNFRFVPVVYQALVVQSCNIVWNAYLSYVQHRASTAN